MAIHSRIYEGDNYANKYAHLTVEMVKVALKRQLFGRKLDQTGFIINVSYSMRQVSMFRHGKGNLMAVTS